MVIFLTHMSGGENTCIELGLKRKTWFEFY